MVQPRNVRIRTPLIPKAGGRPTEFVVGRSGVEGMLLSAEKRAKLGLFSLENHVNNVDWDGVQEKAVAVLKSPSMLVLGLTIGVPIGLACLKTLMKRTKVHADRNRISISYEEKPTRADGFEKPNFKAFARERKKAWKGIWK